jgi:TniQ
MFPPLTLVEAGTSEVESLEHYVARMAVATGQSNLGLLSFLDRSSGRKSVHNGSVRVGLLGPGELSMSRLCRLEELTGVPALRGGTLWALNRVLRESGTGMAIRRRWCPACLLGSEAERVADRLVWSFSHLATCSTHGVDIESVCPHCGGSQPYGRPYSKRVECIVCKQGLAHRGVASQREKFFGWVDHCLRELVAWGSSDTSFQIPAENYDAYVARVFDGMDSRRLRTEPSFQAKLHHLCVTKPSITGLLNLAALQGVTVLDILLRPKEASAHTLFDLRSKFTGVPFPYRDSTPGIQQMQRTVQALLREKRVLPSAQQLGRRSGIQASTFALHCWPDYCLYRKEFLWQRDVLAPGIRRRAFVIALHLLTRDLNSSKSFSVEEVSERASSLSGATPKAMRQVVEAAATILFAESEAPNQTFADGSSIAWLWNG